MYIVKTYKEIADFLGVKPETVAKFRKLGMPVIRKNKYDLKEITQWYIKRVENEKGLTGDDTPALEKYRLARAELAEIELAETRKQLLPRKDVERYAYDISKAIAASAKKLEAQDEKAAYVLFKELEAMQKRLKKTWDIDVKKKK